MSEVKFNIYESLYEKLDMIEREKWRHINCSYKRKEEQWARYIKCIKIEEYSVLVTENETKEKWENYFHKLYSKNQVRGIELNDISSPRNILYCRRIAESSIKSAFRNMRLGKSIGPDDIYTEVWKCVGER